jgi:hypothetical protein
LPEEEAEEEEEEEKDTLFSFTECFKYQLTARI